MSCATTAVRRPESSTGDGDSGIEKQDQEQNEPAAKSGAETAVKEKPWKQTIPEWFLKHNVNQPHDLSTCHHGLYFECQPVSVPAQSSKSDCQWSVPWEEYLELRDTSASALTIGALGYPLRSHAAILIQSEKVRTLDAIDAAVVQVARETRAKLLAFDLGDLQDIAWEFNLETIIRQKAKLPRPEPAQNGESSWKSPSLADVSPAELVAGYQFVDLSNTGDSSPKWTGEGPVPRPTTAVLDAATLAGCASGPGTENPVKLPGDGQGKISPTIIHIRLADDFLKMDRGTDCLKNFADAVRERRENGDLFLLLVSTFKDQTIVKERTFFEMILDPDPETPQEQLRKALQIRKEGVVTITATQLSQDDPEKRRMRTMHGRSIRRTLRHTVPVDLLNENHGLAPYPKDDFAHHQDIAPLLDKTTLSEENAQRTARQLCAVLIAKRTLAVAEIKTVLEAVDKLHKNEETVASEKFKAKLKGIEKDCSEHEKELLSAVVDTSQLETGYDDVVMDPETKEMINQLISLSQLSTGKSHPLLRHVQMKGALFYGPPGTGKTHLTRAIANESNSSMLAIDAGQLLDKWVGQTEKNILAMFSLCKKLHPCILFIDEADALFYRRTSCDQAWRRSAVTLFLQQMDGLLKDEKTPFVIVATNRPSDLDEAFLRRLPHKTHFSLPTESERKRILRLFLKDEDIEDPIIIEQLARKTEGYSGADIKALCGQAALMWSVDNKTIKTAEKAEPDEEPKLILTASHFTKALRRSKPAAAREIGKINDDFNQGAPVRTRARN